MVVVVFVRGTKTQLREDNHEVGAEINNTLVVVVVVLLLTRWREEEEEEGVAVTEALLSYSTTEGGTEGG